LRALARDADRRPFAIEAVPETIRRLLDSLNQPAYVTGRRWDLRPGTRSRRRFLQSAA
jgi:hypothetical protein